MWNSRSGNRKLRIKGASKEFWLNAELKDKDINNLRAISYEKKELIVNTENLINIDKHLDDCIDKSKKNDFEIEEIENGS